MNFVRKVINVNSQGVASAKGLSNNMSQTMLSPYGLSSYASKDDILISLKTIGDDVEIGLLSDKNQIVVSGMQGGEVAVGNPKQGSYVYFKANGDIEIKGTVKINGNVSITGSMSATEDVKAGNVSLEQHLHAAGALLDSTGSPVTGSTAVPT